MQPYRGIAWWAYGDDHCICANILSALLPTRIGSVDPHALETTARRTESTLPENAPSHFTLRRHICGWRADSGASQRGARGMNDRLMKEGSNVRKIACVGDHSPPKCCIATITCDVLASVATAHRLTTRF